MKEIKTLKTNKLPIDEMKSWRILSSQNDYAKAASSEKHLFTKSLTNHQRCTIGPRIRQEILKVLLHQWHQLPCSYRVESSVTPTVPRIRRKRLSFLNRFTWLPDVLNFFREVVACWLNSLVLYWKPLPILKIGLCLGWSSRQCWILLGYLEFPIGWIQSPLVFDFCGFLLGDS